MTETLLMPTARPPPGVREGRSSVQGRGAGRRARRVSGRWLSPAGEISCVGADGLRGLGSLGICGWRGARIRPAVSRLKKELKPERIDAL